MVHGKFLTGALAYPKLHIRKGLLKL